MRFMSMLECIKKIGLKRFILSRIITPKQYMKAWNENYKYSKGKWSFGEIIFFARYDACKAIPGYDFIE